MKLILLTQGEFAKVDDEDYPILSRNILHCSKGKNGKNYVKSNGISSIPHLIMGKLGIKCMIGYKDDDALNLQKENLYIYKTNAIQGRIREHITKTSKFVGVSWYSSKNRWRANIQFKNKHYFIGLFKEEIEAAKAYNAKVLELYGDNGRLNII